MTSECHLGEECGTQSAEALIWNMFGVLGLNKEAVG